MEERFKDERELDLCIFFYRSADGGVGEEGTCLTKKG